MTPRKLTIDDVIDTKAKIAIGLSAAAMMGALAQSWMQGPPPKGKRRRPPPLFWLGVAGSVGTMGWLYWRRRKLQQALDRARAQQAKRLEPARDDLAAARAARSSLQARLAQRQRPEPREADIEPVLAQLTIEEQGKLDAVFAELPADSRLNITNRLAALPTDRAVEYLRDLLARHTAPPLAEAA
jgi:hypothetical protein